MRKMQNIRTGVIATFDEGAVATGRWVEYFEPPPEKEGIDLGGMKIQGSLHVGEPIQEKVQHGHVPNHHQRRSRHPRR